MSKRKPSQEPQDEGGEASEEGDDDDDEELSSINEAFEKKVEAANAMARPWEVLGKELLETEAFILKGHNNHVEKLPAELADFTFSLLKTNMEVLYGDEWDDGDKREELEDDESRFLIAVDKKSHKPAGFLHFRFVVEEGAGVLYVYELQIASDFRKKGLGRRLMDAGEKMASAHSMGGVLLTVFHHNVDAIAFYTALGYTVNAISPRECNPAYTDEDCNYNILGKVWDADAVKILEFSADGARAEAELCRSLSEGKVLTVNGKRVRVGPDGTLEICGADGAGGGGGEGGEDDDSFYGDGDSFDGSGEDSFVGGDDDDNAPGEG